MSTQEAFLSRIRQALQMPIAASHTGDEAPAWLASMPESAASIQTRLRTQRAALVARLQDELRAVGGQVMRVESVAEATAYVTQLARDYEANLVVRWEDDLLEMLEVDAALQEQGVEVHTAGPPLEDAAALANQRRNLRDLLARADVGLSGADYVIAETGTLALSALPGQMRGVSLLPPVHVAVVRPSQIVATMADCLAMLQDEGQGDVQARLTSCVSFITGPSRTGDIELSLTIGVHGPGELHLVILDDPSDTGPEKEKWHVLEYDKNLIGREFDRYSYDVTKEQIIEFSTALGETNRLYTDESYAKNTPYGGIIAPPTFCVSFRSEAPMPDLKLSYGKRGFDGGKECRFVKPIRPGDTITGVDCIAEVYEKTGRSGNMIFIVRESEFTNQDGETVAVIRQSLIRRD